MYAPDWRTDARVDYTCDLIRILTALVPDGLAGGISTTPLSYKAWIPAPADKDWEQLTLNVVRVAERLVEVRRQTGRSLHLDLEPEPDCLLETSGEAVEYFQRWLQPLGGRELARRLGIQPEEAREHLREHVHFASTCATAASSSRTRPRRSLTFATPALESGESSSARH